MKVYKLKQNKKQVFLHYPQQTNDVRLCAHVCGGMFGVTYIHVCTYIRRLENNLESHSLGVLLFVL